MPPPLVLDIDAIDLDRVLLTREQIYEELPHRHEFMQVDALVYMDLERGEAIAYRDVRADEFWVRGHLPGRPILPGVLMIESAAQIASFVAARHMDMGGRFIGLGGVDKAKFRDEVVPNQRLYILARLIEARRRRIVCSVQGLVNRKMVFECQLTGMAM